MPCAGMMPKILCPCKCVFKILWIWWSFCVSFDSSFKCVIVRWSKSNNIFRKVQQIVQWPRNSLHLKLPLSKCCAFQLIFEAFLCHQELVPSCQYYKPALSSWLVWSKLCNDSLAITHPEYILKQGKWISVGLQLSSCQSLRHFRYSSTLKLCVANHIIVHIKSP